MLENKFQDNCIREINLKDFFTESIIKTLSVGGYCIINDWGVVPACKKAVEDYGNIFAIQEAIQEIDWTGVFRKKEIEIPWLSRT
jgi:hypothetical protein